MKTTRVSIAPEVLLHLLGLKDVQFETCYYDGYDIHVKLSGNVPDKTDSSIQFNSAQDIYGNSFIVDAKIV